MVVFGLWGLTAVFTVVGLVTGTMGWSALATGSILLAVLSSASLVALLVARVAKRDDRQTTVLPPRAF